MWIRFVLVVLFVFTSNAWADGYYDIGFYDNATLEAMAGPYVFGGKSKYVGAVLQPGQKVGSLTMLQSDFQTIADFGTDPNHHAAHVGETPTPAQGITMGRFHAIVPSTENSVPDTAEAFGGSAR